MRISPRALAAIAALAVAAAAPQAANATTTTFGVDLSLVAANSDTAKTCAGGSWWYAENGVFLNPVAGSGSCQFTSSGIYNNQAFGLYVPASGTVTQARIKIGSVTGPMRINLVRTLFQQTGSVANPSITTPYLEEYGPTFTPQANAITTVPLNLKVQSQATPDPSDTSTIAGTDWLAVELLSPDTPVPLSAYGGGTFFAAFPGPTAVNFPAPSPNPLPNYGQIGYVVNMNADLVTGSSTSTPGGGGAGGGTGSTATVGLNGTAAKVSSGAARLGLLCKGADCSGKVTLQPAAGKASAAAATTYGSATFSGKADKKFTVKIKLNSKGKRLLARKRTVKVRAIVALTGAKSSTTLSVTLKR